MYILKIENVSKNFGGVRALEDINFKIKKNTITSVIGPNGAGKTTLFNTISGLYLPDKGKITLNSKNITGFTPENVAKAGLSRTFQNIRLFPEITVIENIMIGMHLRLRSGFKDILLNTKKCKNEEVKAYLDCIKLTEYVGLKGLEEEKAKNLSYGNQRKLEIGRALALNPILLMLDEPAAGLNSKETDDLKEFILKIKKDLECSVLLIEHDIKLIMEISDRISVLNYGRLIASGSPDEISNNETVINAYLGEPDEFDDSIA